MLAFLKLIAGQPNWLLGMLLPLSFLLGASDSYAQLVYARFRGKVLDSQGNPIVGARVTIEHTRDNRRNQSRRTHQVASSSPA